MSFNDKEFWITKDGHLSDREAAVFDSSSRIEAKRAHQWFSDAAEPELFPNKRQAVHTSLNGSTSEIAMASSAPWETSSGLHSGANQFIDRLFGVDTTKPVYRKVNDNQIRDDPSVGNINMSISQVYSRASESQPYNAGAISSRSIEPSVEKDHSTTSIADSFTRGDSDAIFGYELTADIDVLARPSSSYGYLHYQSSVQKSETHCEKHLDASNANTIDMSSQTSKPTTPRNKSDSKPARKEAPNSFPSNVRSLIATGLLEGVPVKYVLSRQEVRGFIKGSGYLCGCEPCNYSKVVNAYEFERHAGCKTKHPNNHIYFENGKTIYQIVQELKSTPESLLFDTIQTVTGSPINQKAFQIWKESFQAATRELQRIYGKEELNL